MCGIAGFFSPPIDFNENRNYYQTLLNNMSNRLKHRGPDEQGTFLAPHAGLAHARLSIIDLVTGQQPMIRTNNDCTYAVCFNGEIYNMKELRTDLIKEGMRFETTSDTEVLLLGYIRYGVDFVKRLNGIYAYAIADLNHDTYYLFRDPVGVKPLFYTIKDGTLVFASEIKGLFEYPGVTPVISKKGLNEVFALGPAKTPGCGVFDDIHELLPGHLIQVNRSGWTEQAFWSLVSKPHEENFAQTVERTAFLLQDAVRMQMLSDVDISTFLSGGIDSSVVSSICANELKKQNKSLTTYSFDFVNNDRYFQSNAFQPSRDLPFAKQMVSYLKSSHRFLLCDNTQIVNRLHDAMVARDLPCMADIESSMLHFCSLVKEHNKVVLTGECADELFGGYPWFHSDEAFQMRTFPWSRDISARKLLLSDDCMNYLNMEDYIQNTYENSVSRTPRLDSDTKEEARRREISYLNLRWFMQTLLDRMDRTSMFTGIEARVPFADIRLVEYLWNVPWEMKSHGGVVKSLLRHASTGLVPDEILWRRKSPYPKTYDPEYEHIVSERMTEIIHDSSAPIRQFIDAKKLDRFIHTPSDYGKPWYGQLMAGPQTLAYLLQVNDWLTTYHIQINVSD